MSNLLKGGPHQSFMGGGVIVSSLHYQHVWDFKKTSQGVPKRTLHIVDSINDNFTEITDKICRETLLRFSDLMMV